MDWVSLPSCQGHDFILIFTDSATKMVHLDSGESGAGAAPCTLYLGSLGEEPRVTSCRDFVEEEELSTVGRGMLCSDGRLLGRG